MVDRKRLDSLLVDGLPLPAPDGYTVSKNDLDSEDTGRDESGYMHRLVLREKVRTWELTYQFLTAADFAYIESLFEGKAEFPVSMMGYESTAYCSNYSAELVDLISGAYSGVALKIIEC